MNSRSITFASVCFFSISLSLVHTTRSQTVGAKVVVRDAAIAGSATDTTAAFEAGATYIAWSDSRNNATSNRDIYIQNLGPDGAPLWTANGLAICTVDGAQSLPSITPDGTGGAVVVWLDQRTDSVIAAQRVSSTGAIQWATNGILVGLVASQSPRPYVHRSTDGGFLVTWWDSSNFGVSQNIFPVLAQKLDGNGTLLWDPQVPDPTDFWGPGIEVMDGIMRGRSVPDGSGGIIAFGKIRVGGGFRFRRVAGDQSLPWSGPVDFTTTLDDLAPFEFAADGAGGVVVAYRTGSAIRAFRVAGDGSLPWGAAGLDVTPSNIVTSQPVAVTGDGQGGAFIAWVASSPRDIRVQHFSASGSPLWAAGGAIVPDLTSSETFPAIVADGGGGIYLSFDSSTSLRAQRLNSSGAAQWSAGGSNGLSLMSGARPLIGAGADGPVVIYDDAAGIAARKIVAQSVTQSSRLINISTRAFVGTGANLAIPGFVISGTGNRTLLIRAVGPTLGTAPFNVPGALADPVLTIYNAAQQAIHTRNDWGETGDAAMVAATSASMGAFPLPAGSRDAAIVVDLPPGLYTAGITGAGNGTGVGIVEVYAGDAAAGTSQLVNISSRVFVGTGADVAIPGFVIAGDAPVTLLIRAVGPTLGGAPFNLPGVLADPILTLFDSAGAPLTTNDDWEDGGSAAGQAIAAAAQAAGAFALQAGSRDATLLVTLTPGSYTAGVVGAANGTGICLVETYLISSP